MPDQFVTLVRIAKKKGAPYSVKELTHNDFVDVKKLTHEMGTNFENNTSGERVFLSKLQMVKVEKSEPFLFFYKTSYSDEEWKTVDTRRNQAKKATRATCSTGNPFQALPRLQQAYKAKLPLNENKIRDLKFLLEKNYIPEYYRHFYESIF